MMMWKWFKPYPQADEVFTLVEGTVTITYPATLSGESIGDLEKYFALFVAKLARQGEDPHDPQPVYTGATQAVGPTGNA
jgi:hypothetical protein